MVSLQGLADQQRAGELVGQVESAARRELGAARQSAGTALGPLPASEIMLAREASGDYFYFAIRILRWNSDALLAGNLQRRSAFSIRAGL
ncbi:MAG: hypothetical protein AAF384_08750 [Pseudomonadota bacterium]